MVKLPPQQLSFSKKTTKWRKSHLDWADSKTFFNYSPVRNSVMHKKVNYDLLNGIIHMSDMEMILNPDNIEAGFIPEKIQHYPIMNNKLNVLRGEELNRVFDFKVIVTNPNSISEIEAHKQQQIFEQLKKLVQNSSQSEEEFNQKFQKMNDFFEHEWQDIRESRANALLNHYWKEYNMPVIFNEGFMDALTVGEEIYQCDIVGGEPIIKRLNPMKVRVFKSGFSNRIEDAEIVILEDYCSPAQVVDEYYDVLSPKDRKYLEDTQEFLNGGSTDSMDNLDERYGFVNNYMIGDEITTQDGFFFDPFGETSGISNSMLPFDTNGNVKVLKVFWKSRRKIKKVKSYDETTGEAVYDFYPETYIIDPNKGEEEQIYYINEAWEGVKIGEDIYVNMRPRVIQYNRLGNPSRCHFGIIGQIYNLNDSKPYSMVDMMKAYNYLYDAMHDRLNKLLARNWGKMIQIDLSKIPAGWDMEKWLYYARINNIVVIDSFKEGNVGASTGKLAGSLNNASSGTVDAELGASIQQYIGVLEYIKQEMSDVSGVSKQREGNIASRETVGGVERATLQSSHITEWIFSTHDDVKKRTLECFLETAKIAQKGTNKKFQYILSDGQSIVMDIDGDEFAESDYGLVVDYSKESQELSQKIDMLAQAALQNQALNFSTIMKLYSSASISDKVAMVQSAEKEAAERQQQAQQQQEQLQKQQMEQQSAMKERELQQEDMLNQRDNDTKVLIAQINAESKKENPEENSQISEEERMKFEENQRQFNKRLELDKERLAFDKSKASKDAELKQKQITQKSINNNSK